MKKITEQQLIHSAGLLNKKLSMMEAATAAPVQPAQNRDLSWQNVGKAAGNIWQGVKNTAGAVGDAVTGAANAVTGAASDVAQGFNSAQTPTSGTAAQPATNKWPTTPQEISAFQQANGLKADGLIGPKTMQALAKHGIQPPAGFQMAGAKKPAAPAKPTDIMAQSPDEAEDERIAQNTAFYNMTPQQQAMYNQGTRQQGQKPATQTPTNTQIPATAPNAAAAAITPNFASQGAQPVAQPEPEQQPTKPLSQEPVIVYKESSDPEMSKFRDIFSEDNNLQSVNKPTHVSFQQENSLARIVQLSHR